MPRFLKTLYPCCRCGDPAQVEHTRDAARAMCEPCLQRVRASSRINWKDESALKVARRAQEVEDVPTFLRCWLEAKEKRLGACVATLEDLERFTRAERRKLLMSVRRRMAQAVDHLRQLEPYVEGLIDETGFEVLPGQLLVEEEAPPVVEGMQVRLSLVPRESHP